MSSRACILVSACLLGAPVRYNATARTVESELLERGTDEGRIVPVCPEVSGGLGTPRPPAETSGGDGVMVLNGTARVVANTGADVTDAFVAGARHAVWLAREHGARVAVLKSNSPSCGTGWIYDGTFSGTRVAGFGVAAAALKAAGVQVFDETQIAEADAAVVALDSLE